MIHKCYLVFFYQLSSGMLMAKQFWFSFNLVPCWWRNNLLWYYLYYRRTQEYVYLYSVTFCLRCFSLIGPRGQGQLCTLLSQLSAWCNVAILSPSLGYKLQTPPTITAYWPLYHFLYSTLYIILFPTLWHTSTVRSALFDLSRLITNTHCLC